MVQEIVSIEEESYNICEEMESLHKTNIENKLEDVYYEKIEK